MVTSPVAAGTAPGEANTADPDAHVRDFRSGRTWVAATWLDRLVQGRADRWATWLPVAWSCVLALLLLGPALGPGYVLSYDMVWVPDLDMRSDFLGLATSLPRVVPSDAVVAVLDSVVPGMVLQKVVLLGSLVAGGLGAAGWCPTSRWSASSP